MNVPVIAIDGPSASGKGAVARGVAKALGFHYLESGALYRLVALSSLQSGIGIGEPERLAELARTLPAYFQHERIYLSDQDVTEELRSEACGRLASQTGEIPSVRQALLTRQLSFRRAPGLVAEGRDMGTVVFPDADLKVYLTASPEVRAERRYNQLIEKGIHANLRALSHDLEARDSRDVTRGIAPLQSAVDARKLDSSSLGLQEVIDCILDWWRTGTGGASD